MVGSRECLDCVYGQMKRRRFMGKSSLRNSTSVFLLPGAVKLYELGRVWILHPRAFAYDRPCVFAMPVCKSTSAWDVSSAARARACVRELWDLAPDVRPELGLVVYIQRVLLFGK